MEARIWPKGSSFIREDKDLIILDTYYSYQDDFLKILYLNIKTREKFYDIIENPSVPVYIHKSMKRSSYTKYIPTNETYCVLVPYKSRERELQTLIFGGDQYSYINKKTGLREYKTRMDKLPSQTILLSPNLFLADEKIESLVLYEFYNTRFHQEGKLMIDEVHMPPLRYASFDIESDEIIFKNDPIFKRKVNVITFVYPYDKVIYLGYLNDSRYKHVEDITNNKDKFREDLKDRWNFLLENQDLGDDKANKNVRDYARTFLDFEIIIREFDTEEELIYDFLDFAFNKSNPDILFAFNAGFDFGTIFNRMKELGMDMSKFNRKGGKWADKEPIIDVRRDHIDPVMRDIVLQNFSTTKLMCCQDTFYKLRNMNQYRSKSLDTTANMITGFGKLDYSKWSNSVITLPYKNMYIHCLYACVDSMLLPLIEMVTEDLQVYYTIINMCKIDMRSIAVSNMKIPCRFNNEAIRRGFMPAVNINKVLRYKSRKEVEIMNEAFKTKTNVDLNLIGIWEELTVKESIKGGYVSNPNLVIPPKDFKPYAKDEVLLANFRKLFFINYNDAKSQYPSSYISGNINATTQVGQVRAILKQDMSSTYYTKYNLSKLYPGGKFKPHLGDLTLAIVNQNVSKIGNLLFGLPEFDEILSEFVPKDSEMEKPYDYLQKEITFKENKNKKLISILKDINSLKPNNDSNSKKKRSKFSFFTYEEHRGGFVNTASHFFIGKMGDMFEESHLGTYLHWNFLKGDLKTYFEIPEKFHNRKCYGSITKDRLSLDESVYYEVRNRPNLLERFDYSGLVPIEFMKTLLKDGVFTEELDFGHGLTPLMISQRQLAFPMKSYIKMIEKPDKKEKVKISDLHYFIKDGERTYRIHFKYSITCEDPELVLEITQVMNVLKLDERSVGFVNNEIVEKKISIEDEDGEESEDSEENDE